MRLKSKEYEGFEDLAIKKKRVPSTKARFCTQKLKLEPLIEYFDTIRDSYEIHNYVGIRADESYSRSKMPECNFDLDYYGCWIHRPLLKWTADDVFELHKKHGIEPNPLYKMGMKRVGCMPCIMANHTDMKQIIANFPEVIDQVRDLENRLGRTFCPPNYIPDRYCSRSQEREGYPCQPFSNAGKRKGKQDPRHLWPYIRTSIGVIQPKCVFFENVEGHITSGLDTVLSDLGELGYWVEAGIFSAEEVGAPHQRKRVFILGIREGYELEDRYCTWKSQSQGSFKNERGWTIDSGEEAGNKLADGHHFGCRGRSFRGSDRDDSTGISKSEQERDVLRGQAEGCGGGPRDELPDSIDPGLEGHAGDADRGREQERKSAHQNRPTGPVRTVWPARPNEAQPGWEPPRTVGKSTKQGLPDGSVGESQKEKTKESERSGGMGDTRKSSKAKKQEIQGKPPTDSGRIRERSKRAFKSPVDRNVDGYPDRMDYAELYEASDNRTDELRLCGNGVVPATVEKAFRTLYLSIIKP